MDVYFYNHGIYIRGSQVILSFRNSFYLNSFTAQSRCTLSVQYFPIDITQHKVMLRMPSQGRDAHFIGSEIGCKLLQFIGYLKQVFGLR